MAKRTRKIEIVDDGSHTKMMVDGEPLKYITYFKLEKEVGSPAELTIRVDVGFLDRPSTFKQKWIDENTVLTYLDEREEPIVLGDEKE